MDTYWFEFERVGRHITAGGSQIALVGDFRSTKGKTVNQTRRTTHETRHTTPKTRATKYAFRDSCGLWIKDINNGLHP